ncbi:acyl carrier protein [Thiohalocapsa halophila]|uniref:acyl carrier protein n=1 Tax=Thiohalocapsa halophila TaxID=69359 RepID=UPI001F5BC6D0|nr:acyl carrier protein [Thiohalocapsa halophila]
MPAPTRPRTAARAPQRAESDGTPPATPAQDTGQLLDILRQLARDSGLDLPADAVTLDTRLEADLGLDSLGRSELIARVERGLGRRLPDEALLAPTRRRA